jgi:mono/diheme cytochrome c family protein
MENRWRSAITVSVLVGAVALSAATGPVGAAAKKAKAKKPAASGGAGNIAIGKKLVASDGCGGCHKIGATGGKTGPELTHVGAKLKASEIAAKIKDPKAKNPNSIMPASRRADKEINAMAAYLASLK